MTRPKLITIVWAPYEGRTASFARQLGSPLFSIHYLMWKRPWIAPVKYVLQWAKTWFVLVKHRPEYIFVTNSPPVAPLCVFCYAQVTRTPYVMDTHPPTLYNRKWGWSAPLTRKLARAAFLNIVDQDRFKNLFETWGARTLVLENPPRTIDLTELEMAEAPQSERFDITFVCTFASDEPVEVVVAAAKQLPDVHFFILGDKSRAKTSLLDSAPTNITFTDYLRGKTYWSQLRRSRAVMSLTTHAYSLLAGAQDGVAVQKPLLLSRQPALLAYFTKGAIFFDNTAEDMVRAVRELQDRESILIQEVIDLGHEQKEQWERKFRELQLAVT